MSTQALLASCLDCVHCRVKIPLSPDKSPLNQVIKLSVPVPMRCEMGHWKRITGSRAGEDKVPYVNLPVTPTPWLVNAAQFCLDAEGDNA